MGRKNEIIIPVGAGIQGEDDFWGTCRFLNLF